MSQERGNDGRFDDTSTLSWLSRRFSSSRPNQAQPEPAGPAGSLVLASVSETNQSEAAGSAASTSQSVETHRDSSCESPEACTQPLLSSTTTDLPCRTDSVESETKAAVDEAASTPVSHSRSSDQSLDIGPPSEDIAACQEELPSPSTDLGTGLLSNRSTDFEITAISETFEVPSREMALAAHAHSEAATMVEPMQIVDTDDLPKRENDICGSDVGAAAESDALYAQTVLGRGPPLANPTGTDDSSANSHAETSSTATDEEFVFRSRDISIAQVDEGIALTETSADASSRPAKRIRSLDASDIVVGGSSPTALIQASDAVTPPAQPVSAHPKDEDSARPTTIDEPNPSKPHLPVAKDLGMAVPSTTPVTPKKRTHNRTLPKVGQTNPPSSHSSKSQLTSKLPRALESSPLQEQLALKAATALPESESLAEKSSLEHCSRSEAQESGLPPFSSNSTKPELSEGTAAASSNHDANATERFTEKTSSPGGQSRPGTKSPERITEKTSSPGGQSRPETKSPERITEKTSSPGGQSRPETKSPERITEKTSSPGGQSRPETKSPERIAEKTSSPGDQSRPENKSPEPAQHLSSEQSENATSLAPAGFPGVDIPVTNSLIEIGSGPGLIASIGDHVTTAASIVIHSLQEGPWPSPFLSFDPASVHARDSDDYRLHFEHFQVVGESLRQFSQDVIAESMLLVTVETRRCETPGNVDPVDLDRVFFGSLLILREVLAQNAERIFGPSVLKVFEQAAVSDGSLESIEEAFQYTLNTLASAVITAGLHVFDQSRDDGESTTANSAAERFLHLVQRYDNGDSEIVNCLKWVGIDGPDDSLNQSFSHASASDADADSFAWHLSMRLHTELHPSYQVNCTSAQSEQPIENATCRIPVANICHMTFKEEAT
jgi:hypothetical protein